MELTFLFAIGLLVGFASGALLAYLLMKRLQGDTSQLTEQILRLAETKLSGKKEVIDGTLQHMRGDLQKVEQLMKSLEKDRDEKFGKIDERLQNAATVIRDLDLTAKHIKVALSGNSSRGQWGERMAEDVLRLAGMIEGINYIKQTKLQESGSRPDFTFLLPQELKLNMDVKFPFSNFQHYAEATTEVEKERFQKEFLKDVKLRIKELQSRNYISPEENTVDYVLLFIPNEHIFSFINDVGRDVVEEAMRSKTILCSPLSLYAILSVIRQSIDNFRMEHKSREMLTLFGKFKEQWEKYKEQMETVKTRFESVHKGYEELTGVRERQLDKPLEKIEELRQGQETSPRTQLSA